MHNRKTYFLDLQTLLTYLHDQSCELTTTLRVSGHMANGFILVKGGKVAQCKLVLHNGRQITGEEAYKQIHTCTQWQVQLETSEAETPTRPPSPGSPPSQTANVWYTHPLRQKRPLDESFLQSLPLKDRLILRSVFTMLDGRRSVADIKTLLPLSAEDIDQALVGLRMLDLIE